MAWKVSADPVDFEDAIAWFRKRVAMTRAERDRLTDEARLRSFWVSHVAQADIVAQAWKAIDKALATGTSLAQFKKEIGPALRSAWSGSVKDPAWRLETIFRTNVQSAYSAGRTRQALKPEVLEDRPVWMFDAILDGRETEICEACDNTKLQATHDWWRSHTPPLHFNCRSSVISLTPEQAGKLSAPPKASAQQGFGTPLRDDEPWTPEPTRYPEQLSFAFMAKTAEPPPPPARLKFIEALDEAAVQRLGATAFGDIKRLTRELFAGKCPDEASWRRIWEPTGGFSLRFDSFSERSGGLRIDATVLAPDGSAAGDLVRVFKRVAGELVVKHEYFVLKDDHQGKGVGESISRSAMRSYVEMGASRVLVDAHWTGRYTWAKFGYSWPTTDAPKWQTQLERFLLRKTGDSKLAKALSRYALRGAHAVAELELDGKQIGKEFLLDTAYVPHWEGELRLADGDVGYEKAKKRLRL